MIREGISRGMQPYGRALPDSPATFQGFSPPVSGGLSHFHTISEP